MNCILIGLLKGEQALNPRFYHYIENNFAFREKVLT